LIALQGGRTGAAPYPNATLAVATFLLTRGLHWLFVLPNSDEVDEATAALLLSDYGPALGNFTVAAGGSVVERRFERGTVRLDCATWEATLPA
jgi:hypothetical protein